MTTATESGTTRRMGRPPLKAKVATVATLVRLTADVVERIDDLAGPNKRAEFIRDAIDKELARIKRNPSSRPD